MRSVAGVVWVFAVGGLPIVGCNDVFTPPDSVSATTVDANGFPIEGVEICETDTNNCELTNDNGKATLKLPVEQEVSWEVTKEGYERILISDVTDRNFVSSWEWTLFGDAATVEYMEALNAPYPMVGTGSVVVSVCTSCLSRERAGVAGATLDLITATGSLFYEEEDSTPRLHCDDDDAPDPCLEATTARGYGGFVKVPPGVFEIEFGGTADRCFPLGGWPGEHHLRVPVKEGYFTILSVECPPMLP